MEKKIGFHRLKLLDTAGQEHYKTKMVKIQQILFYAESRFWSILIHLAKADNDWGQILLHRELVSKYN